MARGAPGAASGIRIGSFDADATTLAARGSPFRAFSDGDVCGVRARRAELTLHCDDSAAAPATGGGTLLYVSEPETCV
jgi:hypothetical protein